MTAPASAPKHGTLLRSVFYACADSIQGPDLPAAPAELARRALRHIAMTIDELAIGGEVDTVAGHAQLAADYATALARSAPPAAEAIDEASAATIRATLTNVAQQIRTRFTEWHGMTAEHIHVLLDQLTAAGHLLDAVIRWGGDADSGRAAVRYAATAAAHLQAAAADLARVPTPTTAR